MKISTADDNSIIIHCERFESGKTGINNSDAISMIGVLPLCFVLVCVQMQTKTQFDLVQFESYLNKHLPLVISITFFIITTVICAIDDLFFKSPSVKTSFVYQVDRNGCFSSYDGKVKGICRVIIEDNDKIVESLKMFVDMPIESYNENSSRSPQRILHKVIVELSTGECFPIEENSIYVFSHPDTEAAFSKLTTETNLAIEQIKSFLEKSRN
jgi:hypothetical protein